MKHSPTIRDYLGWGVPTWSRAIHFWRPFLATYRDKHPHCTAIEVGAREGGLSLFLATEFGMSVTCTDRGLPAEAKRLHTEFGVQAAISYAPCSFPGAGYPDESFDVVAFKSVLGAIGEFDNLARQEAAIREFHRILKPGGLLIFAENLKGSRFHQFARKYYVSWGRSWKYITIDEMKRFAGDFSELHYQAGGTLAAFTKNERLESIAAKLDSLLSPWIPEESRYFMFGCATK